MSRVAFARVLSGLSHRGPDGEGVWPAAGATPRHILLGHRRLAVVDPTPAGAQPAVAGASVLVYNGELYNQSDVDAALSTPVEPSTALSNFGAQQATARPVACGAMTTATTCDTHTVLAALQRWGPDAVAGFEGMYAFAFASSTQLVLSRDHVGMKPLYFARCRAHDVAHVAFASELRALVQLVEAVTGTRPRPDLTTLSSYLTTIRTTLGERTLFAGCHAVEPGQTLTFDLSVPQLPCVTHQHCARAASDDSEPWSDADYIEGTRVVLDAVVQSHLRSDVPLCVLLSGGLDSAILAALARPHVPQLHTFCAGARDDQASSPDFDHAREMAHRLGSEHHEAIVTRRAFHEQWADMVHRLWLPLSTPNEVAIRTVARTLREHGCVVALSGEGADELFAGYDSALDAAWLAANSHIGSKAEGELLLRAGAWVPLEAKAALLSPNASKASHHDTTLRAWYRAQWDSARDRSVCMPGDALACLQPHLLMQQQINLRGLLERLDTSTMLEGVEGRTPFADVRTLTWANHLPMRVKYQPPGAASLCSTLGSVSVDHARTKWVLREAFRDCLPTSIVQRPKASFPLPFEAWIDDAAGDQSLLESDAAREVFVMPAVVDVLRNARTHWHLAWPVLNVLRWLRAVWA